MPSSGYISLIPWQAFKNRLQSPGYSCSISCSLAPEDLVDISTATCATRLLELHSDNRSILQFYPFLAKDPALVSEYLLLVGAYERSTMPTCYGLQLTVVASCLVAHLQDEFGSIIIDQYLSQSDLLFILSAGGVYSGSLGSTRTFASECFRHCLHDIVSTAVDHGLSCYHLAPS